MGASVVLLSGGLDSQVLLHTERRRRRRGDIHALYVDYGHKTAAKEAAACTRIVASVPGVRLHRAKAEMPWLSQHMLVDHMRPHIYFLSDIGRSLPPPTAKSQERAFVVPFRNMVFLSMAVSLAASVEADVVSGAFNYVKGGEAALDKSEEFLASLEVAARNATEPHWKRVRIHNSFQGLLKRAIIKRGLALGVDFSLSWSCYNAYKYPCGQCGPCHRRRTIFKELGVDEGVRYHTKEYVWSKVDHYVASVT